MRFPRLAGALPIALAAVLVYLRTLGCGYVWDDDDYVTQNPVLRTAGAFWSIWFEPASLPQYYPLVHSTFWLEYRLWGPSPLGYHAVNVLLHAASAVLFWRLLVRLAVPGALFGALLFAVHPVHVESVAWVTERKNVLSLLFALLAAHGWWRWRDDGGGARAYGLATAAFVGALLSKTVTATLPGALLVLVWWRRGRLGRRDVLGALPWFAVGLGLGAFTAWLEATHVGAATVVHLSPAERLLVAGRAVWFYLGKLAVPYPLCFHYERWQLDAGSPAQWACVVAAVAAVAIAIALRHRLGRGPAAVLLLFGGMLVPALGFVDVYPFRFSFVADHFQYHASLAMLAGGGALLTLAAAKWPARARFAAAAVLLTGLGAATVVQCGDYRDLETLWQATLRHHPDSSLALSNLGGLALQRGDLAAARDYSERALRADPGCHEAIANLGILAHRDGDLAEAERRYREALRLKPNSAATHHNLGALMRQQGKPAEALRLLRRAVELDPDYYDGHVTLCAALAEANDWNECLTAADWVLKRTPGAIATRLQAIDALLALRRTDQALGNALLAWRGQPTMPQALDAVARAIAASVRSQSPDGARTFVAGVLQRSGIPPAALLPALAEVLRRDGAGELADAVEGALKGH